MPQVRALFTDVADFQAAALGMRFDVANMLASEWVQQYHMVFAQPAMDTTIADLQSLIAQAQNNGWTIDEISKQIDATFDYYLIGEEAGKIWREIMTDQEFQWFFDRKPRPRRDLIARTETMRASNAGTYNLYMESGEVELKEWLAAHDRRTRDTHVQADATYREGGSIGPIPMNEPFIVGGFQMMYPLDGSMGADIREMANCRCTMAPVLYEFEEEEPQPEQVSQPTFEEVRDSLARIRQVSTEVIGDLTRELEELRARSNARYDEWIQGEQAGFSEGLRGILKDNYLQASQEASAVWTRLQEVRKMAKEQMHDAIRIPADQRSDFEFTTRIRKADHRRTRVQTVAEWLNTVVSRDVQPDRVTVYNTTDDRAFHMGGGKKSGIHISKHAGETTIAHEWGHRIEYDNPDIQEKRAKFYERRTAGEAEERLKDVTSLNYDDWEVTKKDDFIDPYIGKVYRGRASSSEVISMGIQYLYDDPAEFAEKDPDMFDFVLGVIRGQ